MENTGRQKFEDDWREAFEGQEMEPSGSVWNNIDLKLDNDKMKRRVLFYQRLAAASVVFALLAGVAATQYFTTNDKNTLAVNKEIKKSESSTSAQNAKTKELNKEGKEQSDATESMTSQGQENAATESNVGETLTTEEKNSATELNSNNDKKPVDNQLATTETLANNNQSSKAKNTKDLTVKLSSEEQSVSSNNKPKAKIDNPKADQKANGIGDENQSTDKGLVAANKNKSNSSSKEMTVEERAAKTSQETQLLSDNSKTKAQSDKLKVDHKLDKVGESSETTDKGLVAVVPKENSSSLIQVNEEADKTKVALAEAKSNELNQNKIARADQKTPVQTESGLVSKSISKSNPLESSNDNTVSKEDAYSSIAKNSVSEKQNASTVAANNNTRKALANQTSITDDNAFARMTAYFAPQLKSNKLPKNVEVMKEEKRVLPEMPASLMTTSTRDKRSNESTWLSFGAAAGSYNPGSNTSSHNVTQAMYNSSSLVASQTTSQNSSRASVGSAYSVGLSVGKRIADRWIVQTGVNYMNQAISYTSNYTSYTTSNDRAAFVADYADKTSAVAISQPYKVNSSSEFVSVPVQAGYLLIDRKIGLQWNAGVATDIFLRNTLKDQSGRSSKYTQGSGDDSPYRSLNVAALTSTELSYRLGTQYRLSLVPGVRYSFQSTLKSETSGSNPLVLDIGFRFRYIFK